MSASRRIPDLPTENDGPIAFLGGRRSSLLPSLLTLLALAIPHIAETGLLHAQAHDDHAVHPSPYADLSARAIKALSSEETAGLLAGDGLGFALAAELNGVPGPLHALEMADELGLSDDQEQAVRAIETRMRERARELGARIMDLEGELDRRFAHGHATVVDVERLTAQIGRVRGELRAVHLSAHLDTSEVLEAAQIEAYRRLRGYEATSGRDARSGG